MSYTLIQNTHGASFASDHESTSGFSSSIRRSCAFLHATTSPQALGVLSNGYNNLSCSTRTNFRVIRFFNCSLVLHNESTDAATFTHL